MIPQIHLLYLFMLPFSWLYFHIHLPQWTQLVQLIVIVLPSTTLIHAPSFIWILHCPSGTKQISPSSIKFPLSQPIPKTQKNKRKDKKQPRRRPWNPIMVWHYNKVARPCTRHKQNFKSSSKDQKHKTDTMTQSPWFPRKAQPKPSSRFHGNLSCPLLASCSHMSTTCSKYQDNHIYQFEINF